MATSTIAVDDLTAPVMGSFEPLELPGEDARAVADHLVEADLRGARSHGVMRVLMNARAKPFPSYSEEK